MNKVILAIINGTEANRNARMTKGHGPLKNAIGMELCFRGIVSHQSIILDLCHHAAILLFRDFSETTLKRPSVNVVVLNG